MKDMLDYLTIDTCTKMCELSKTEIAITKEEAINLLEKENFERVLNDITKPNTDVEYLICIALIIIRYNYLPAVKEYVSYAKTILEKVGFNI